MLISWPKFVLYLFGFSFLNESFTLHWNLLGNNFEEDVNFDLKEILTEFNIYIENLEVPFPEVTYLYNSLGNECFSEKISNKYIKTKSITFKGMKPLKLAKDEKSTEILSIPVTIK